MTPLTTKAAEIRAGLVAELRGHVRSRGGLSRDAETGEIVLPNGAWAMMLEAADLIEQQAAELAAERQRSDTLRVQRDGHAAELVEKAGIYDEQVTRAEKQWQAWEARATSAESERDELLREKERLGAERDEAREALIECEGYFDNRADADCDQDGFVPNKEMRLLAVVREAIASTSQDSGQNLADAHSKSPDPSSQSERIAALEAAGRKALRFIEHTESERGITFDSGDTLRAALAPLGEAGR